MRKRTSAFSARSRLHAGVAVFLAACFVIGPEQVHALHVEALTAHLAAGSAVGLTENVTVDYAYDDNGNMIQRISSVAGTTNYTYDSENRLIKVADPNGSLAGVTTYAYDTDGIRTAKITGTGTTTYLTDKNRDYAQVLEERNGDTRQLDVRYTYGHDLISQHRPDGQSGLTARYYHYDGQLSTRQLSDNQGDPTDRYTYDAFGELLASEGETANNYLYTGEQFDGNAGFYYLRARYYAHLLGRFINRDTVDGSDSDPRTLHKYLYCAANPVTHTDPTGNSYLNTLSAIGIGAIVLNIGATIYSGIRHGLSAKMIRFEILVNLAFFVAIGAAIVTGGLIGVFLGGILVGAGLAGLINLIDAWPNMDTTDQILAVIQVATFVAYGGALGSARARAAPPARPTVGEASVLPESYFGSPFIDMAGAPPKGGTTIFGWPKNAEYFWKETLAKHPEFFDSANLELINPSHARNIRSPKVNEQWVKYHTEHAAFMGETLHHHHLGQGRYAVSLPKSVHERFSGVLHPHN